MTRIVTVANLKGGIGKTTTVINIGAGLALRGVKVLMIDTDPQGNLSSSLGVTAKHTLYELMIEGMDAARCIVAARHNLDLIVADTTLLTAQTMMSRGAEWGRTIERALEPISGYYDMILLDSSGSLNPLNANALVAAHDIIAPTTVEPFSVRGLELLHQ
jgi:chromosome partitioning protein